MTNKWGDPTLVSKQVWHNINVCPTGTKPVLGPNSLHDTIYMVLTSDGFSPVDLSLYSRAASTEQRSKLIDHDGHSVWKL